MHLNSWGNFPQSKHKVLDFDNANTLRKILAHHNQIIPYGNGRSYGDSALGKNIIKVRSYDYFIDFDESSGILHVQAGVLLSEILESFVPRGWFLKITPGTRLITVGGAIASDVHGKNHHQEGCFSECIEDFEIMLANGEIVRCSKRATPELFYASCGGQGLTGIILNARIQLKKIHSSHIDQIIIKTENLRETFDAFKEYKNYPYSVAWIDCMARKNQLDKCILTVGDFRHDERLKYIASKKLNIPFHLPSYLLNSGSVKAFNHYYYNKIKNKTSRKIVDIDTFFYPLDAIENWNRIYGRKGFTQYQFILPLEHSFDGLNEVLNRIANSGKGTPLAVLKLYGPANKNYLSFPLEGYSLALDFKIEKGLFELLDVLDQIVTKYNGRIYLAKDARISKASFEKGYPLIDKFRQFRIDNNMNERFQSLQSRRVGI